KERRAALTVSILIMISTIACSIWLLLPKKQTNKIIILVADFYNIDNNNDNKGITQEIMEQLRLATAIYSDIQIQSLNKTIDIKQGQDIARKEGTDAQASIVI